MKRLLLPVILLCMFIGAGFSQAPDMVNYQAVARDGSGTLLVNENMDVRIGIYAGPGGAVKVYEETHNVTTNDYGMFSLRIGDGSPLTGTFAGVDWGGDEHHLMVEIDNGSGYVDLGMSPLVSVPYAKHAGTADLAGEAESVDMGITDLNNVADVAPTIGSVLKFSGGLWGPGNDEDGLWEANGNNAYYNAGYVGIGTNAPGAGLELKSADGYGSAIGLNNTGGGLQWRLASWTDGTFRIVKTSGTTFSAMVFDPDSRNVGIGTDEPDQRLGVHTSSGISYINVSDGTTGPSSGLRLGLNGTGNAYIINDESGKSLSLGTSGTSHLRINEDGEVGINITSPGQTLHIKQNVENKSIRLQHQSTADYWENGIGTTTKNYKFYYNNLFRADISSADGAYTMSSDRRLKENIELMPTVLDRVLQLRPSTYQYIGNPSGTTRSIGLIAQDVQPLFPELVRETDDGYYGLVYDGFAVISIKAIQELNDKVNSLEAEIEILKQALDK